MKLRLFKEYKIFPDPHPLRIEAFVCAQCEAVFWVPYPAPVTPIVYCNTCREAQVNAP